MRIAVGSDHAGFDLKRAVADHLRGRAGVDVVDVGAMDAHTSVDYPDFAAAVTSLIRSGEADLGVLVCGTGIGISIAANKVPGIRCALVHDEFTARAARQHNHANILAMGGRLLAPQAGIRLVDAWLNAEPEPRHEGRLAKIRALEPADSAGPSAESTELAAHHSKSSKSQP